MVNIHDIGVLPDHRGKGVGKALIDAIEAEARRNGCCKITLETQSNNAGSRRLYARAGFGETFLDEEAGPQLFLTKQLNF